MQRGIKNLSELAGLILSWTIPARLPELLRAVAAHIYTGFLRRRFYHFGSDSVIAYKATNLHGLDRISIGDGTQIARGVQLTAWQENSIRRGNAAAPKISIGNNCNIRDNCHITAANGITIGDNLLTGTNVLITDNSHGAVERLQMDIHPQQRRLTSKGTVYIGNNVWLANNVCIMPGVTIGDGVIVGANSVVTHDIPPYCMAAGIPAGVIKQM